jgi:hypothetical protein
VSSKLVSLDIFQVFAKKYLFIYSFFFLSLRVLSFCRFGAEIFLGLHDDVRAIMSRSKNLEARVTRLEADLPSIEKALRSEACQFRFAYTART